MTFDSIADIADNSWQIDTEIELRHNEQVTAKPTRLTIVLAVE